MSASVDSNSGTTSRTGGSPSGPTAIRASVEHVEDVAGVGRERHDVPATGLHPEPGLDRGDRPERGEHLAQGHVGGHLRGQLGDGGPGVALAARTASARRWTSLCWRISSEARWNPNVASCQRSSASSPQATRPRPSSTRAAWSSASSASSSSADVVVAGPRAGVVGQGDAGATQSLGDEPEALAVRLVGESAAQLAVGLGQVLGVAAEPRRQGARHVRSPDVATDTVCMSRIATAS